MKSQVLIVVLRSVLIQGLLYAGFSAAQPSKSSGTSVQDIAVTELLEILDQETEIATKSRINVDYVPGMVTVLHAEELQALGVLTVREALSLVPGYQPGMGNGRYLLNVRGVPNTFTAGSIKYLVNGIEMNMSFIGDAPAIFEIPIAQVERIEVIRGPGSAVHGEFAYTGVVDVITRDRGVAVFNNVERYDTQRYGGLYSRSDPHGKWRYSLNIARSSTNGADVISGPDALYGMGMGGVSYAPGPANDDGESESVFYKSQYKDYELSAQFVNNGQGEHFGSNDTLPPPVDRIAYRFKTLATEAKQILRLSSAATGYVKLGWERNTFETDRLFLNPPGFAGIYVDGMYASSNYDERKTTAGISVSWSQWNDHDILTEISYANTKTQDIWHETNYVPSTGAPIPSFQRFTGSESFLTTNPKRSLTSLILQDTIEVTHEVTTTIGLHYDDYNDVGNKITPRLAGVWRHDHHNIFKAQYARAFRPPTFSELYNANNPIIIGNPAIKSQTSDNYEVNHIYRDSAYRLRTTLFYSELRDIIVIDNGVYANSGKAKIQGIELEAEHSFERVFKLKINFSHTKTQDRSTGSELPGTADTLLNTGLIYAKNQDLSFSVLLKSVSDYKRAVTDARSELRGNTTLDFAARARNVITAGIMLQYGIKNIFDASVVYPAQANTYPDDYPQTGRYWWTSLSLDFN